MRCEDLTRELASPTGGYSSAQMAEHLADCPACAEWSRRARRFDRIWESTRPSEPSMDAMDALWARASVELDARMVPATLKFEGPSRRRRWAIAALVTAQAAAILVAALVLLRRDDARPVQVADVSPVVDKEPELLELNVESDELLVVRIGNGNRSRIEKHNSPTLPAFTPHDEMDEAEASASTWDIVASK